MVARFMNFIRFGYRLLWSGHWYKVTRYIRDIKKAEGGAKCRLQLGGSFGRTYVCDLIVEQSGISLACVVKQGGGG